MDTKKILITGVSGQDGSNMTRYLLRSTNHLIYGGVRRLSVHNYENINDIKDNRFKLVYFDLLDNQSIINMIKEIRPDFVINFAAQSFVGESWNMSCYSFTANALPVIYFLEAIKEYCPKCRFYSAGSSEELGDVNYSPQDIHHPLKPRSPYGASKCAARHLVKVYRESYNLYAIHCILFNHEGTRRGKEFVTRKITSNMTRIKKEIDNGLPINKFELGNIFSHRDWSDSEDFVEAVWLMLNKEVPREYVLSSNQTHSVKEFVDYVCEYLNLDVKWDINVKEPLKTQLLYKNDIPLITISETFYRPAEVDLLWGNCKETMDELNWAPKSDFKGLIRKMVDWDLKLLEN